MFIVIGNIANGISMVCLRAFQLFKDMKLHERKRPVVEHKFKGREEQYAKDRYQKKLKDKSIKDGFVRKDTFELQFGFSAPTTQPKSYYRENRIGGTINGVRV